VRRAIEAVEDLFAADSRAANDLLEPCRRPDRPLDRTGVSMLKIDSLLTARRFDARRRIARHQSRHVHDGEWC